MGQLLRGSLGKEGAPDKGAGALRPRLPVAWDTDPNLGALITVASSEGLGWMGWVMNT